MGHGPSTFKKRDVRTALEAVRESGVEIARIEIDKDGKIVIVAGKPVENSDSTETKQSRGANEWDSIQ